jgi:peptidoglycan/xylan/chitin deacetylase (PgdA/CDA1 family)
VGCLSGDFDSNVDGPRCYENVVTNVQKGSIVVLHDNLKSIDTLKAALPEILDFLSREGYQMLGLLDNIR